MYVNILEPLPLDARKNLATRLAGTVYSFNSAIQKYRRQTA